MDLHAHRRDPRRFVVQQPLSTMPFQLPTGPGAEASAYFVRELSEFAEAGARLSGSHPTLARHLGRQSNNPDVERLIEGTAFLCAQIRARIDACAPQYVHELGELAAPWLLRDMPSATVVGIDVPLQQSGSTTNLAAGTSFMTGAASNGLVYRTSCDVALLPMRVSHLNIEDDGPNRARLTIGLKTSGCLTFGSLESCGLTFFISGPQSEAGQLAVSLWHGTCRAELHSGNAFEALPVTVARSHHLDAAPLTPQFDGEPPMPTGLAALRDQFVLPHKMMFFTVHLCGAAPDTTIHEDVTLSVIIDKKFSPPGSVQNLTMHLNAVPAINLAQVDAMPLRTSPAQTRYVLRPDGPDGGPQDVLAVHSAELLHPSDAAASTIAPLRSYRWANPSAAENGGVFYTLEPGRQKASPAHLQLHYAQDVKPPMRAQTVSARVWAHDTSVAHPLPAQSLTFTANHPTRLKGANLCPTSSSVSAAHGAGARSALVDFVAQRGRSSLTKKDVVRVLTLLHRPAAPDNSAARLFERMLGGINEVVTQSGVRLWKGAHVMCLDVDLELDANHFDGLADAYLLADGLARLWADTLPIHGVLCMRLRLPKWGRTITWPLRCGPSTFGNTTCTYDDERR